VVVRLAVLQGRWSDQHRQTLEVEDMSEPWAAMAPEDQTPGLPSVWVAMAARADAREAAAERREADDRAERAENRRERALWVEYQRALLEGREGVDPSDPRTYVLSPDEMASRVFAEQDREADRNQRKALIEAGLVHVLNVPASEMTAATYSSPEPYGVEAEGAARNRRRSVHSLANTIRRTLGRGRA
jgi:hypothetical protein